ncbi:MAG: N-acetylmuramoyl-L-alanine amidase [Burkholderiaceae bacterium]|nr:N-acetylmuramoyl-L-alanine amidase [Burkholderiaceae bacterium]
MRRCLSIIFIMLLGACSTQRPGGLTIDRSIQAKSQNSRVEFLVLHYTATGNLASLKILSEMNVSSHYLITDHPQPHVYELVDESRRAWHAGVSQWFDRTDLNSASIGVEIVNQGKQDGQWAPYPKAQINTLITLLNQIVARHQIKPHNIIGHSDISPQRKIDPGPLFPWAELASHGLGRWYDPNKVETHLQEFAVKGLPTIAWLQTQLNRLGYTVPTSGVLDKATRNVIAAFQMHYRPAIYDGQPDAQTMAIAKALITP